MDTCSDECERARADSLEREAPTAESFLKNAWLPEHIGTYLDYHLGFAEAYRDHCLSAANQKIAELTRALEKIMHRSPTGSTSAEIAMAALSSPAAATPKCHARSMSTRKRCILVAGHNTDHDFGGPSTTETDKAQETNQERQ